LGKKEKKKKAFKLPFGGPSSLGKRWVERGHTRRGGDRSSCGKSKHTVCVGGIKKKVRWAKESGKCHELLSNRKTCEKKEKTQEWSG